MEYGLVMPFLDESPGFCHGYECGTVSELMRQGRKFDRFTLHSANVEQVKMIAKREHYTVSFQALDDTWSVMDGWRTGAN